MRECDEYKGGPRHSSLLGTHDCTLGGDGLETSLDALDRAFGVAGHALEEKQPVHLEKDGVGRPAGVAGDVFLDVFPENRFDVPLLKLALQNQLIAAVNRAHCAQLGAQEGQQMFGLTMKRFSNVHEVDKG